jgi:hypothetical protein
MKKTYVILSVITVLFSNCGSNKSTAVFLDKELGCPTSSSIICDRWPTFECVSEEISGGVIGAPLNEQDSQILRECSPKTLKKIKKGRRLHISDIVAMSNNGLSESVILSQIEITQTYFDLSCIEVEYLENADVSQRIINYMIAMGE